MSRRPSFFPRAGRPRAPTKAIPAQGPDASYGLVRAPFPASKPQRAAQILMKLRAIKVVLRKAKTTLFEAKAKVKVMLRTTNSYEARPLPTDISDRIPIEIYENVIEHMDRSTLFIAALVARAWYPRATCCLYYSVIIPFRASYDLLVKQLHTSHRVRRWLQSTHKIALGDILGSGIDSGIPFLDAFPLVLGHACPALKVLQISRILRPNMHPTFHLALRQFQHIVALRLYKFELSNIAQFRQIVCAFMCLEELTLLNGRLIQPQPEPAHEPAGARLQDDPFRSPCNIRLKRLTVGTIGEASESNEYTKTFQPIAGWLACSGICSSLVVLVTMFRGDETDLATEHVNRLLEVSGQSLTSLEYVHDLLPHDRSPCNLVHNTALRQLTLNLVFDPYKPTEGSDFAHAASELRGAFSTVRSYQLEDIALHFTFWLFSPPNKENFSQSCMKLEADSRSLNDVLVGPYFKTLRDTEIELDIVYDPDHHTKKSVDKFARAMAPLLLQLFKPWHDRGILDILTYVKARR